MICYMVYNMAPLPWPRQAINVRINIVFKFTHGTLFQISGYDEKEVAVGGFYWVCSVSVFDFDSCVVYVSSSNLTRVSYILHAAIRYV